MPPRKHMPLTSVAFARLLEACETPPMYLEVLANNNGLYSTYTLNGPDDLPLHFSLMVQFPFGPFANGSLFMHHSFDSKRTTCIISATRVQLLVERLFDVFSTSSAPTRPYSFLPVAALVEHFRIANEDDHHDIDRAVCHIENRSGVSLHNFGSRTRAKIGEYALLQRELHVQDALIVMAEHCFSFHTRLADFLVEEEWKFRSLLDSRLCGRDVAMIAVRGQQADYVRASLKLNASMSTWTLQQLYALEKRLKVQLRVIDSTIQATDALTMINLARASHSDSSTMKAITVLTMVFLPATFVCSLFGTGFFEFANTNTDSGSTNRSRLHVAGQFWIYFAVTVPLTVVVLGVCALWLAWSSRKQGGDEVVRKRRAGD